MKDFSGKPLTAYTLQGDKGCFNPEFKYKNKLSSDSIVAAFIPYKHDKKNANNCFSFAQPDDRVDYHRGHVSWCWVTMYTED